jgi:small subunit ribosomal protein S9
MMASSRQGLSSALRGVSKSLNGAARQPLEQQFQSLRLSSPLVAGTRCLSTEAGQTERPSSITAAPEVDIKQLAKRHRIAENARPLPVSRSYFSRTPIFNDRYLALDHLSKTYSNLPVIPAADAERISWKTLADLRQSFGEPVKATDYVKCLTIIKRLHTIHPELKPDAVTVALQDFKRDVQAFLNVANPIPIDKFGRALGVGKRKASTARAFVVEGDGQVLVNGKTLADYFGRVHDRESAVWALHSTDRVGKYNVWARVEGGGTTGQAEALTLAIAKALLAHEPALKPALRRGEWSNATPTDCREENSADISRFQPAVSPATRGGWRGRSMAVSRRERDRHGSRDRFGWAGCRGASHLHGRQPRWDHRQPCLSLCKLFFVSTEPRITVQYKARDFLDPHLRPGCRRSGGLLSEMISSITISAPRVCKSQVKQMTETVGRGGCWNRCSRTAVCALVQEFCTDRRREI